MDPEPTLHFNADLNPAPHQNGANLQPLVYRVQTLQKSIMSFHASIVRVHGPPRLHTEPLKLLNFDINANPAFHSNADPDPASQNIADPDPASQIIRTHADPDAQPAVDKTLRICIRPS